MPRPEERGARGGEFRGPSFYALEVCFNVNAFNTAVVEQCVSRRQIWLRTAWDKAGTKQKHIGEISLWKYLCTVFTTTLLFSSRFGSVKRWLSTIYRDPIGISLARRNNVATHNF